MIKSINAEELKTKLDKSEEIILIDCREQGEWDEGHIQKAQFIALSNFEEGHKVLDNKSAEIILQCRSGKRSMNAAKFLEEQGYENLTNLEGGILGWMDEGLEIVK